MKIFKLQKTVRITTKLKSRLVVTIAIIAGIALIRILLLDVYYIPTSSMEDTLKRRSYVLLSKFHYGPIMPQSTYEIPFFKSILKRFPPQPLFKDLRLPGLGEFQKSDIIIADNGKYKIAKRIVGLPHDTIQVQDGFLFVNSIKEKTLPSYKYKFSIELTEDEARKYEHLVDNITYLGKNKFEMTGSNSVLEILKSQNKVPIFSDSDSLLERPIYPKSKQKKWGKNNYGPIIIPSKGMKIRLNTYNYNLYKEVILKEEKTHLTKKESQFFINDRLIDQFEFTKDYFFVMGDNRMESIDSRYIGFIPKNRVIGKIVFWL